MRVPQKDIRSGLALGRWELKHTEHVVDASCGRWKCKTNTQFWTSWDYNFLREYNTDGRPWETMRRTRHLTFLFSRTGWCSKIWMSSTCFGLIENSCLNTKEMFCPRAFWKLLLGSLFGSVIDLRELDWMPHAWPRMLRRLCSVREILAYFFHRGYRGYAPSDHPD